MQRLDSTILLCRVGSTISELTDSEFHYDINLGIEMLVNISGLDCTMDGVHLIT